MSGAVEAHQRIVEFVAFYLRLLQEVYFVSEDFCEMTPDLLAVLSLSSECHAPLLTYHCQSILLTLLPKILSLKNYRENIEIAIVKVFIKPTVDCLKIAQLVESEP